MIGPDLIHLTVHEMYRHLNLGEYEETQPELGVIHARNMQFMDVAIRDLIIKIMTSSPSNN